MSCKITIPGNKGIWHGYDSYRFEVEGIESIVVTADSPLKGNPWIWRARFFNADPALDLAMLGILIVEGGVLDQALIALVVAFHTHDDQFLLRLLHELVHAPGLAEGGILIEKDIMTVKHIHDGVALLRLLFIGIRQVDIGSAGLVPGEFRNGDIPLFDHVALSSVSVLSHTLTV